MKIPQEIQDLMPKRRDEVKWKKAKYDVKSVEAVIYNRALTEVEKVLPQIIALAEKRGVDLERERIANWAKLNRKTQYVHDFTEEAVIYEELIEALTLPTKEE